MLWIDDTYDLHGDSIQAVTDAHPDIAVTVLPVPFEVIGSVVTLEDCLAFYDSRRPLPTSPRHSRP